MLIYKPDSNAVHSLYCNINILACDPSLYKTKCFIIMLFHRVWVSTACTDMAGQGQCWPATW